MEKEKKSLRQIEDSFSTHGERSGMGKYKYFAQFTIWFLWLHLFRGKCYFEKGKKYLQSLQLLALRSFYLYIINVVMTFLNPWMGTTVTIYVHVSDMKIRCYLQNKMLDAAVHIWTLLTASLPPRNVSCSTVCLKNIRSADNDFCRPAVFLPICHGPTNSNFTSVVFYWLTQFLFSYPYSLSLFCYIRRSEI